MPRLWQENVRLAPRTRYRIGGPTPRLADVGNEAELRRALSELAGESFLVLGGGANTLVSDEGVRQPVLVLEGDFKQFEVETDAFVAGAGVPIPMVVQAARREARRDWHLLEAVPGTMGGALTMNAGTKEWGVWSHVDWVEAVLPGTVATVRVTAADVNPGYRHTHAPEGTLFLRARLRAAPGDRKRIERAHLEYRDEKVRNQPYDHPSCGSVWTNPPGHSVWKLIDEVGMRGAVRGGAQISDRHTNFIINVGAATAEDITELMLETRRRVRDQLGIVLHPEVRLWGFPDDLLRELGALGPSEDIHP
ncbi:MAG: FAD-binding protein [Gemmatimonadetes bacterium]|nr:FAD-binding protein [Gemmatimonadota bacterium]